MIDHLVFAWFFIRFNQLCQACTNSTPCDSISSTNNRVIMVYGFSPKSNCISVKIGNDFFVYDSVMINVVWITLNNTDNACITNSTTRAQDISKKLNLINQEVILLNVTAQYFRIVIIPINCTTNCSVYLQTRSRTNNSQTPLPISDVLNQLGPYCLNGGTIDTSYRGAGYKCNCSTNQTSNGPVCEYTEVVINATEPLYNIFRNSSGITLRFSIFSNGITGGIRVLTIKDSTDKKVVEVGIFESSIVFNSSVSSQTSTISQMKVDDQKWYDFVVEVTTLSATLTVNDRFVSLLFVPKLETDFRYYYLVINEIPTLSHSICMRNLFVDSKVINFNNYNYKPCCQDRCTCKESEVCNCSPFISNGSSRCYCKPGSKSYSKSNCEAIPYNETYYQMTNTVIASLPLNNSPLTSIDFGFRTLLMDGTLLSVYLSNPQFNINIQIVNGNLTLNVSVQSLLTIYSNVSNGQFHNVTLNVNPYSLQMILDRNLNYTVNIANWTWPITNLPITVSNVSLGSMKLPNNNQYNNMTTCFSTIQLNITTENPKYITLDTTSNLSPGCSSGLLCSSSILNCSANQVCKEAEWKIPTCECKASYTSVNSTCVFNQCVTNPCLNGGQCTYLFTNNYTCICPTGFSGNNCEIVVATANLYWIAAPFALLLLIILIALLVYYCCYRKRREDTIPIIDKVNENIVSYNDQAGECDYEGPPIDFNLMIMALRDKGFDSVNTPTKSIPGLMSKKEEFDKNNTDLILDHPLEYGFEGCDSDDDSLSSIGSKSAASQYEIPAMSGVNDDNFSNLNEIYNM